MLEEKSRKESGVVFGGKDKCNAYQSLPIQCGNNAYQTLTSRLHYEIIYFLSLNTISSYLPPPKAPSHTDP